MPRSFSVQNLIVSVHEDRRELGEAAGGAIAGTLRRLPGENQRAAVVFASAPSQNETLEALTGAPQIDWGRVAAFHLDEYLGIGEEAPQSFRRYLREHLLSRVPLGEFHGLRGEAPDPEAECTRYASLLDAYQPQLALLGIGENGHLAFIDPPVCRFDDPRALRVVTLDETCRLQQVHDGIFAALDEVPRQALSMTIPRIMAIPHLFVMVPGPTKPRAVRAALAGPVTPACPASILRTHPDARLFLDHDSAALIP